MPDILDMCGRARNTDVMAKHTLRHARIPAHGKVVMILTLKILKIKIHQSIRHSTSLCDVSLPPITGQGN